jgi:hypothetical protein
MSRFVIVFVVLALAGCSRDRPASQMLSSTTTDAGLDASRAGMTPDAGDTPLVPDAASSKIDASDDELDAAMSARDDAAVAPTPACPPGEVLCDDECIEDIEATASALQMRVFARSCALSKSCHTGFSPKEGLNLTSLDDIFGTAVDKPSQQDAARKIIDPGHPEDSYLIAKLRNLDIADTASTGKPAEQMPPPPLSSLCEVKIARVEAWIAAGAKRD